MTPPKPAPTRGKKSPAPSRRAPARPKPASTPRTPARRIPAPAAVKVRTGPRPGATYSVLVGSSLLTSDCAPLDAALAPGGAALLLVDSGLPRETVEPVLRRLDRLAKRWGVCVLSATEADKSLDTAQRALAEAGRLRLERSDAVIALGGGIVTDVAGFVAAVHRRGCRSILCPTTLLAMVDAAVGGKTGVNLLVPDEPGRAASSSRARLVKNAVGAFHQPALVVCDTDTLLTLPPREFHAGLAECIKHALIGGACGDPKLLAWTEANLPAILARAHAALAPLIARNVALKARVVAGDEMETSTSRAGGRMRLNLGHTFAHAIETLAGLSWTNHLGATEIGPLKHGEAVGLGLIAAAHVSESLRLIPPTKGTSFTERVRAIVAAANLPTRVVGLPPSPAILDRMLDDKKVAVGRLRLILPTKGLACRVKDDVPAPIVAAAIDAIRAMPAS